MTFRERYMETLLFGNPDKVPLLPGGPRESTLEAWRQQGLVEEDHYAAMVKELGLPPITNDMVDPGVSFEMLPMFEEKVIDHKEGHYVVQDWQGAIVEISDKFDVTYLRFARDFVTRKWHKFPVENRDDFERMKERYKLDTPGRFPEDFPAKAAGMNESGAVTAAMTKGPFWKLRDWLGFENLCVLFMDDPDFVREMIGFWRGFVTATLQGALDHARLDRFLISEDMAYKAHSMISPAMAREFLQPSYFEWVDLLKSKGCQIVDVDSDGYIGELIPVWIEAGINCCCPIEVAAHNDIVAFRRQFGKKMAYTGGVDKRAMAAGGSAIKAEIERVAPLVKDGGYIPGCDHGVPPDVSWPNFIEYSRLLAQVCGWM